jgi:DNA polymerase III subunit delta'
MSNFPIHPYPWQLNDWQQLVQQIAAQKLPHAMMIAGPKGIGKRHLADALGQLLLCTAPIEGTACGRCRGCELNKSQTHPDLLWLEPEEEGKAIKVDQVRELTESLGKTAQQGGYKVVVIEPAESMNGNAANALLKSLEEPAANTLLILVTHAPGSVLPTIRSRCQLRKLPMPRNEQVLHWLSPLIVGSNTTPDTLLIAARGAPLTALKLLQGDVLEQREQTLQQFVRLTLGQVSAIEVAANWQGGDVVGLVEWLLGLLHSLARWRTGASDAQIEMAPPEWRERLGNLNLMLLHRYIEKVLLSKRQLLSGANPNKQLLLEELLLDWGALLRASTNRAMASGH